MSERKPEPKIDVTALPVGTHRVALEEGEWIPAPYSTARRIHGPQTVRVIVWADGAIDVVNAWE